MDKYSIIFDEVMMKQLKKISSQNQTKIIISKMLNKIELLGPLAGKLVDSRLFIYELKNKHPPIRMYFKHNLQNNEIYVFEFQMKTSQNAQDVLLKNLKRRISES